jgi:CheY-like chemotaxis protein
LPVTRLPIAEAPERNLVTANTVARTRDFTVLYAEDNEVNILVVRKILATLQGCQLRVARSGNEAFAAAQGNPPDIILLDMHLGDMNAIDVARMLEEDDTLKNIPRIMLSADALPETGRTAHEHGFAAYLTKPVQVSELLACIERNLPELS